MRATILGCLVLVACSNNKPPNSIEPDSKDSTSDASDTTSESSDSRSTGESSDVTPPDADVAVDSSDVVDAESDSGGCGAGQYVADDAGTCSPCETGTYSSSTNALSCSICAAGSFAASNQKWCIPFQTCAIGTEMTADGTSSTDRACTACPGGESTKGTDQTSCCKVFAAGVTYSEGPLQGPVAVAIGDFNGDHKPDIAVANNTANTLGVFTNAGNGTFGAMATYDAGAGSNPGGVAVGDFDKDGWLDIALTTATANTVNIYTNKKDGTFAAMVTYAAGNAPLALASGDFDGDGYADVVVANTSDNTIGIFLNDKTGALAAMVTYATGNYPVSIAVGDFNGDGAVDIAVANQDDGTVGIFLNNAGTTGTFKPQVTYSAGAGSSPNFLVAGDFNGDSALDVAISDGASNGVQVILNNGLGVFSAPTLYTTKLADADAITNSSPVSITAGDFNGDSLLDFAVVGSVDATLYIFMNEGKGAFAPPVTFATVMNPNAVAVGDVNGDGAVDVAVAAAGDFSGGDASIGVFLGPCE